MGPEEGKSEVEMYVVNERFKVRVFNFFFHGPERKNLLLPQFITRFIKTSLGQRPPLLFLPNRTSYDS